MKRISMATAFVLIAAPALAEEVPPRAAPPQVIAETAGYEHINRPFNILLLAVAVLIIGAAQQ